MYYDREFRFRGRLTEIHSLTRVADFHHIISKLVSLECKNLKFKVGFTHTHIYIYI